MTGAANSPKASDFVDDAAPQIGLRASVGLGKTEALIARAQKVLKNDASARVAFAVPDHRLAAEIETRLIAALGPGVPVAIWRGTDRPDPSPAAAPGATMCRRPADLKAAQLAGGTVSDVCGSKRRGWCPFHPEAGGSCAYATQVADAASVRVWVITHAMLQRAAPPALQRSANGQPLPAVDLLVIDEAFAGAMVRETFVPLTDLDAKVWRAAPVPERPTDPKPGYADKRFRGAMAAVVAHCRATAMHERHNATSLVAARFSQADCREAARLCARCIERLPGRLLPAALGSVGTAIGTIGANNRAALGCIEVLHAIADMLAGELGSASLRTAADRKHGLGLRVTRAVPIHKDWLTAPAGVIHADATMDLDIVGCWLPHVAAAPISATAAPHMHVVQVADTAFGYSAVVPDKQGPKGRPAAEKNRARLSRLIETLAQDLDGCATQGSNDVLAILPKALEKELGGKLPPNVGTLHFGSLRGQDEFKGSAGIVVVSRPLPRVRDVEDLAEVIFKRDVARLPDRDFYPERDAVRVMSNGTGLACKARHHPDKAVEAVRRSLCEAELVQAIGRGRGARRTAADPLTVYLLTDVPLDDVPAGAAVTLDQMWADLANGDPVRALETGGVVPDDWRGIECALTGEGFLAGAKQTGAAARSWFNRRPAEKVRLDALKQTAFVSHKRVFFRGANAVCTQPGPPPAWTVYRYRQAGQRNGAAVAIHSRHPDPHAAAEAALGPLVLFAPAATVSTRAPARTGRTTKAAAAAIAALSIPAGTSTAGLPPPVAPASSAPPSAVPKAAPAASLPTGTQAAPVVSLTVPPAASPTLPGTTAAPAPANAVPLGLPAVLGELVSAGSLTRAGRQSALDRFRRDRHGPLAERERRALIRLAVAVGGDALVRAGHAAAARRLAAQAPPPAAAHPHPSRQRAAVT